MFGGVSLAKRDKTINKKGFTMAKFIDENDKKYTQSSASARESVIFQSPYDQGYEWFKDGETCDILRSIELSTPGSPYARAGKDILKSRGILIHPKFARGIQS